MIVLMELFNWNLYLGYPTVIPFIRYSDIFGKKNKLKFKIKFYMN